MRSLSYIAIGLLTLLISPLYPTESSSPLPHSSYYLLGARKRFDRGVDRLVRIKRIPATSVAPLKLAFDRASRAGAASYSVFMEALETMVNKRQISSMSVHCIEEIWQDTAAIALSEQPVEHDPDLWFRGYGSASQGRARWLRATLFEQTKAAARLGYKLGMQIYRLDPQLKELMQSQTRILDPKELLPALPGSRGTVQVYPSNLVDTAIALCKERSSLVAVNLCHPTHPDLTALTGLQGNEEDLLYRSNYIFSIEPLFNANLRAQLRATEGRISPTVCIYSPNVQLFRKGASEGFALMPPLHLDILGVTGEGPTELNSSEEIEYREAIKEKVRIVLRAAHMTGHKCLVLTPLIAPLYGQSAPALARCFHETLLEREFLGQFSLVAFAVADEELQQAFTTQLEGVELIQP